jgi:hypothetical protein
VRSGRQSITRHVSNCRLDGEDVSNRAAALDVIDFSLRLRIRSWVIDNLANGASLRELNGDDGTVELRQTKACETLVVRAILIAQQSDRYFLSKLQRFRRI